MAKNSNSQKKTREIKPEIETFAKIKVIGVGGSGGSAINRMVDNKIKGVEFIAVNTDAQALSSSLADQKIQIGINTTKGLGAGMDPEAGARSAEENLEDIEKVLSGSDMVFITCGLGGGTGTGAAPIVADIARANNALTVAIVTKPFNFEGAQRKSIAERGLNELENKVDTIITIPNDRILGIIDRKTSLIDSFKTVDEILYQGIQGISEIITVPGLVNVDFADVKAIMSDAGSALMGIGRASGDDRSKRAAKEAIDSPLLDVSISGAKGILFTVTGGNDLTMFEVNEIAEIITASADGNAKIIFGTVIDESLKDEIKVMVIATGFENFNIHNDTKQKSTNIQASYTPNKYINDVKNKPSKNDDYTEDDNSYDVDDDSFDVDNDFDDNNFQKNKILDRQNDMSLDDDMPKQESELDIPAFLRRKMK
ncbi:MAG: cell division protein FtsZ [Patescibacteria group bacterium]|nr:cell division protein FtsZ [Patescibacteria group bacterium]MDD4304102.1 cell division protein FtsZ [Patescibacteria group bacterium]MDD4694979.1 cell division protein FtsZ [Patescibacteria group bacterium]